MWVHVRTSMNVFVVTTSAIRKPHATASHGLWYTVKAFLVVPTRKERYYKSGRGRDELDFMSQTDFKYDCCFYGQSVSGPELLTLAVFLGEPDKYAESQSVFCHRGRFRDRVSKSVPLLTGIAE